MRTVETKVYEFAELSERAKDKARDWYREGALDYDWWDYVYEDAGRIGLKITSFDLGGSNYVKGDLTESVGEVCRLITKEHGKSCDTYKLAQEFYSRKRKGAPFDEEEFKDRLCEKYRIILRNEMEYLTSDEAVDESIQANGYTFTEDGERFG